MWQHKKSDINEKMSDIILARETRSRKDHFHIDIKKKELYVIAGKLI